MKRGYTTRRLEVYALHSLSDGEPVKYVNLFSRFRDVPAKDRIRQVDDKLVAIPDLTVSDELIRLIAYEGARGMHPMFYNLIHAKARIQRLQEQEILATKTHGLINLKTREAIIEYNQRGAKANDIAKTLELIGRDVLGLKSLTVELTPMVDESFVDAISHFKRIRLADLKVARPNPGWNEHYDHLSTLAEESDARNIEIVVTADYKQSLSHKRGIVAYIKEMAKQKLPSLKRAQITGTKEGEQAETSISLSDHIEHQKVLVRLTSGHVDGEDIEAKMLEFMHARDSKRSAT